MKERGMRYVGEGGRSINSQYLAASRKIFLSPTPSGRLRSAI